MASRKRQTRPTGPLTPAEALALVYLWCNAGSYVSDVRAGAPLPNALAVLRRLRARGYASMRRRRWQVTRHAAELVALGTRLQANGLGCFRLRSAAGEGDSRG